MDKNKIIEGAAKLVAKGAYDKAIKEYQKVLSADPRDVRVLQKMGELYQKKNENTEAAKYFTKVAESYSADGFFLKAVALYKQVLKLNPDLLEVNFKLAELHQQLGLMSEATAYFQLVANHYDKQGDTKSSLDTLKKMVDLDPENVSSRTKLAELYARENMVKEASGEFHRVADYLKRNNRTDDYLRVAERLSTLEPDNVELARELAQNYLQKGDQKRALAKLQVCFKADPRSVPTLSMLAEAFAGLGQTTKTLSVFKELAKIHAEQGHPEEAEKVWNKIEDLDPNDADVLARKHPEPARSTAPASAAIPVRPAGPAATPEPPSAPAPARPPVTATAGLRKDQLAKLLTETDVYVKYGLHDKALEHLRRVFQVDPENLEAHEKAYQIYVGARQEDHASEQLLNVLRLCTRRNEVERAQPYLSTLLQDAPRHPELPAFLAVLRPGTTVPEEAPEEFEEEAILVEADEEEVVVSDAPEDALAVRLDMGLERAAESHPSDDEVLEDEPLGLGVAAERADLDDEPGEAVLLDEDAELHPDAEPTRAGNFDDALELAAAGHDEGEVIALEEEPGASHVRDEAEQDESSFSDLGFESAPEPTELRTLRGASPSASAASFSELELDDSELTDASASAYLDSGDEQPAEPALDLEGESRFGGDAVEDASEEAVVAPADDEDDPVSNECDEASFFLDQGLYEEAREVLETVMIARPGHPRGQELLDRLNALEEAGLQEAPHRPHHEPSTEDAPPTVPYLGQEPSSAFDLAAELADELGEMDAAPPSSSAVGDDFQYSVEEVFAEFKKGLEKVVKPEDVETHYDLGIAYKEMGLMEDAIGEFKVAREGCIGKKKEVDCLTMTALLQGMQGEWNGAVESLRTALNSEHATGETRKALTYELAQAHEAAGAAGKALFQFERVAKLDPGYREVQAMVSRLSAITQAEPDVESPAPALAARKPGAPGSGGAAPASTRKVGYL